MEVAEVSLVQPDASTKGALRLMPPSRSRFKRGVRLSEPPADADALHAEPLIDPDPEPEPSSLLTRLSSELATTPERLRRYEAVRQDTADLVYTVNSATFAGADHHATGVIEEAHASEVFCALYIGEHLASCALDGSIHVRDAHSHALLASRVPGMEGSHNDGVFQLAGFQTSRATTGCLLSIDWSGFIKTWTVPSLKLCSTTLGHPKALDPSARYGGFSIAVTRTGEYAASGGGDGCRTLKLWRVGPSFDLSLVSKVEHAHDMVYHLDFAPQADFLVSIGTDSSIRLWAVPTLPSGSSSTSDAKELGARLLSHTAARPSSDPSQPAFAAIESIPQLARFREKLDSNGGSNKHALFSPDGETLATCGSDLHIKLWSVPALELKVSRERAHLSEIRRLSFSPDGSTLASCSLDASVRLWSASALSPIGVLSDAHLGKIFHVVFAPFDGGRTITSCGADHAIKVWATPTLAMSAGSKPGAFSKDAIGVGFLGDARALLAVGADLTTKVWVLPSFAELAPARAKRLVGGGGGGATGCASAGSNGSGGGGGANGAGAVEQAQGSAPQVESRKATLSPDGRLLAAMLGREGQVRVWAVDSLQATTATSDSAAPATGQPAGAVGTGGTAGGGALALAAPTVTFLFDQRLHHVPSYAVCFTHDSTGLVSGSEDGSICVWALKPDRSGLVSTDVEWKAHGGDYIANVACHPDGDMLASMSVLASLKLWRLSAGKISQQLFELKRAHLSDANAHLHSGLAFAPSGTVLASSGDVLKLWAVKTHAVEEIAEMRLSARASVAFSPDSATIALARDDGAIACYFTQHLPTSDMGLFERGLQCVTSGDMAALRALPESALGARDVRRATFGWSLLHHACKLLDMEAVEVLIEASPLSLIDALAPPFDSVIRGKHHTLRIRPPPSERPAWRGAHLPIVPIVPSVLDVALRADAKGCIASLLEALTRLVHEDPHNATSFTRTKQGERFMEQLMAIGDRYPELLSALLPALGFAHQPSGKCTANVVGTKQMYVSFSDEATPYALARANGHAGSKDGVKRFWALSARRPRPHMTHEEDERSQHSWAAFRSASFRLAPSWRNLYGKRTGTNYTSCVVPFCGNYVQFLICLERLNGRSTRAGLYDNPITSAIVKAFWRNGAGRIHLILFLAYGALMILIILYAVAPILIDSTLLIVFASPFIVLEAFTLWTAGSVSNYLTSAFNWADIANYATIFILGFPGLIVDDDSRRCLLASLVVLMGFKVLFYMRAYTTLVRTVLQAVNDIRAFVAIVVLILTSFAIAIDVLTRDRVSESSLLMLFSLMLGEFDTDTYAVDERQSPTSIVLQIMFYAFSLMVSIVLLNLLIAILGDSYDVVTERKKAEFVRMRAQLVIEYARLFPWLLPQRGKWLHVLVRTALTNEQRIFELEDESSVNDEWSTRLTQLKNSVSASRKEQQELRQRSDWKMEALQLDIDRRIDGLRFELSAKLDSVLEQLGRTGLSSASEPMSARQRKRNTEATMAVPPTRRGRPTIGDPSTWKLPGTLH